ncbi:DUF4097 family beta strand repeat-containing protein [Streptomyces sp. MNP-20]|uniref:DUF4097 family beta strand repeat-containing protein n=1 Tax=Streptomyces sp. MNP-20 TaxID=2721165 RepID=UPI001552B7AF|nr:DUF4097 family beta strand repeat-containing protein [Streptomyces sp. MNP-20]
MRKLVLASSGLALLSTALVAGCGGSVDDEDTRRKRAFALDGEQLTISRGEGDLDVRPADVDQVEVTRWFSGWSAVGGEPKASWKLVADRLSLSTDCGFAISDCSVRYEVRVPKAVRLTVEGDNGKTTASGFDKPLRIRSDNGAVDVSESSGRLTLHSDSGELRATGITSDQVDASSDNGKVHLSFTEAPDEVGVTTENGGVTVEVPDGKYKVTTKTDNGDVNTDVPTDENSGHAISARTDNGSITVRTTD